MSQDLNPSGGGTVTIGVKRLAGSEDLPLPEHATQLSAGVDLLAAVQQDMVMQPGARAVVPTGLCIELPQGYEAQVRPRSGLALKHGITVLNSPGTIDADYRGEVGVILINLGDAPFTIRRGERIAQMVVAPVSFIQWRESEQLNPSDRGQGGFGSTGTQPRAVSSPSS